MENKCKWYYFWSPKSGTIGGVIFVILCILFLYIGIFFSAYYLTQCLLENNTNSIVEGNLYITSEEGTNIELKDTPTLFITLASYKSGRYLIGTYEKEKPEEDCKYCLGDVLEIEGDFTRIIYRGIDICTILNCQEDSLLKE